MTQPSAIQRLRVSLSGNLQGVGFRPFVFRLAVELRLKGWVQNSSQGVRLEAEGTPDGLKTFINRIQQERPPSARIHELKTTYLPPLYPPNGFTIKSSGLKGEVSTQISPDLATCGECLKEIFNPNDRRYLYPFTNCAQCGPRFSIIETLPYDRFRTSMKNFSMCARCQKEYENPDDRRFHAQANACADCGPHLEFWDRSGRCLSSRDQAIEITAKALLKGRIVAVKGLGGFHLMVDARNDESTLRLRERKHRAEKPFALMYPSLEKIKRDCEVSRIEERLLISTESPIVLLPRKESSGKTSIKKTNISDHVAPGNPYLGVMLPYAPPHHILLARIDIPLIATSGNLSDDSICVEETEALERLKNVADFFLVHNRAIVNHCDDSIARVVLGREQVLRRARGYAPRPIILKETPPPLFSAGGHLKSALGFTHGSQAVISQHVGDLENSVTFATYEKTYRAFTRLYAHRPKRAARDLHPDYASTGFADSLHLENVPIQHHAAHVFSCIADNELEGPVLGIAWDGAGYGLDGTIWGGEFFHITAESIHRVACLRPFPLPGGERAIKEPRRCALGILYALYGENVLERSEPMNGFNKKEITVIKKMLKRSLNAPMTSSCGRLFDAVASLAGVRQICSFEGQAAMDLEFAIKNLKSDECYPLDLIPAKPQMTDPSIHRAVPGFYDLNLRFMVEWAPMIEAILKDKQRQTPLQSIALKFHNSLVESTVKIAREIGEKQVVLTGGCFQNKYLTEKTAQRLRDEGFRPYWHRRVPPNDGGLALGQILAASRYPRKG